MTETDAAVDRTSLVPGVHRLIRAIDGKEGPFAGALVVFDDTVAVSVDLERLGEWRGWAFSDAEHVCGALDIRRRSDGHDVLLPWCSQRVEAFFGRRDASDSPLTPGELGTLVASLLRGVRELGADADAVGDWWLTGDGRPLFVHGEGGSARSRTAALVERMLSHQADRATVRVLEEVASALRRPRHPADDDRRWEQQLFTRAAPRALQLDVFAPERVSDVSPRLVAADAVSGGGARVQRRLATDDERRLRSKKDLMSKNGDPAGSARRRDGRADHSTRSSARQMLSRQKRPEPFAASAVRLIRSLAAGAGARIYRVRERPPTRPATQGNREGARTPKSSRRRAVVLAGALGAIVLIVGLLWPSDGGDGPAEAASRKAPAAAEPNDGSGEQPRNGGGSEATKHPTPVSTPSQPPLEEDATPDDGAVPDEGAIPDEGTALEAAPALLDAIKVCVQEGVEYCVDAVAEGARTPAEGIASLGATESTATLVDDYGDVSVIRLTPVDAGLVEQMMVLERRNDIWLVRDVYDVAHQPD